MPAQTYTPLAGKRKRVCVSRSTPSPHCLGLETVWLTWSLSRAWRKGVWIYGCYVDRLAGRCSSFLTGVLSQTCTCLLRPCSNFSLIGSYCLRSINKASHILEVFEMAAPANVSNVLPLRLGGSAKAESCTTLLTYRSPVMVSCTRWWSVKPSRTTQDATPA